MLPGFLREPGIRMIFFSTRYQNNHPKLIALVRIPCRFSFAQRTACKWNPMQGSSISPTETSHRREVMPGRILPPKGGRSQRPGCPLGLFPLRPSAKEGRPSLSFWKRKKEPACSSGSWKNKVPSFLPLLAGLILTLLAIFAARQRISAVERDIMGKAAPTEIVVATNLIPKGALFSLENLSKRSVPSAGTSRRNIPAPDFELLLGARTKVEISDGEPVLWTDVEEPIDVDKFSLKIAKGRRAITIDADMRASFSGLLRPGDHVDLLRKRKDARGFT
ncbi:MAG: Flp pilus assembly protein CpaB, partial [Deltaproteobacteria bacterium]